VCCGGGDGDCGDDMVLQGSGFVEGANGSDGKAESEVGKVNRKWKLHQEVSIEKVLEIQQQQQQQPRMQVEEEKEALKQQQLKRPTPCAHDNVKESVVITQGSEDIAVLRQQLAMLQVSGRHFRLLLWLRPSRFA
jgi:hypothetical protein